RRGHARLRDYRRGPAGEGAVRTRRRRPRRRGAARRARRRARAHLRAGGRRRGGGVRRVTASAPGKLFLAGEYAVLAGAPALVAGLAAHALFQEGRGSGADVAAAARGGVLEFRRSGGRITVAARALPRGLHLLVGWSGEGGATDPMLRRFATGPGAPRALGELSAAAERAATAVERGDGAGLLDAVASSADLLARLGAETGIPIVTPALARLVAAARRVGAVAKPSGAGGGDCGIALATSPAEADAVTAAWRAAGIVPLPVAIAAEGV